MKVFWYQGGLHLEPESDVETEALIVLLSNVKYERQPDVRTAGCLTCLPFFGPAKA